MSSPIVNHINVPVCFSVAYKMIGHSLKTCFLACEVCCWLVIVALILTVVFVSITMVRPFRHYFLKMKFPKDESKLQTRKITPNKSQQLVTLLKSMLLEIQIDHNLSRIYHFQVGQFHYRLATRRSYSLV